MNISMGKAVYSYQHKQNLHLHAHYETIHSKVKNILVKSCVLYHQVCHLQSCIFTLQRILTIENLPLQCVHKNMDTYLAKESRLCRKPAWKVQRSDWGSNSWDLIFILKQLITSSFNDVHRPQRYEEKIMVETAYHWCTWTVYTQDTNKETTVDNAQHLTGCD